MIMGKLSLPVMDYKKIYNDVFSEQNIEKKSALQIVKAKSFPNEKREYIFKRYEEYQEVAPHFERLKDSEGISKDFREMLTYIFEHDAIFSNVKERIYASFRKLYNRCPYCMISEPMTLDHYLSKSTFPEFTLFPPNLVPCCSGCNSKKSAGFLDQNGKRKYLHIYYDKKPEKPVLIFQYVLVNDKLLTGFMVDESLEGEEYDLYRKQFEILELGKRMNNCLSKTITMIFKYLYNEFRYRGKDNCYKLANDMLCAHEDEYGVNHYETAIFRQCH